jgi:hypothetical protein
MNWPASWGTKLGHVVSPQPVAKLSQLHRDVLGVTEPGSRDEIFKHYADLQDNLVRKHRALGHVGGEDKNRRCSSRVPEKVQGATLRARTSSSPGAQPPAAAH